MSGTILGVGDMAVDKVDKNLDFIGFTFQRADRKGETKKFLKIICYIVVNAWKKNKTGPGHVGSGGVPI